MSGKSHNTGTSRANPVGDVKQPQVLRLGAPKGILKNRIVRSSFGQATSFSSPKSTGGYRGALDPAPTLAPEGGLRRTRLLSCFLLSCLSRHIARTSEHSELGRSLQLHANSSLTRLNKSGMCFYAHEVLSLHTRRKSMLQNDIEGRAMSSAQGAPTGERVVDLSHSRPTRQLPDQPHRSPEATAREQEASCTRSLDYFLKLFPPPGTPVSRRIKCSQDI